MRKAPSERRGCFGVKNKPLVITHRAHVFYSGRVQGVGFRYTAEKLAMDLGLVGWVKNLPDNRVELVCEGPKRKIELLLKRIQESGLGPYIQKTNCAWEKPSHQFKDFGVEFHF
jgi:acylphosphatase